MSLRDTKESLEDFRRRKAAEAAKSEAFQVPASSHASSSSSSTLHLNDPIGSPSGIWLRVLANIDVLDSWPFRTWRRCFEYRPRQTLLLTAMMYLLGQVFFNWIEFGLVFFLFSIMVGICLSLGKRQEGEASAYSVFNPNCERLLGQMTSEHFERDVLRRRI